MRNQANIKFHGSASIRDAWFQCFRTSLVLGFTVVTIFLGGCAAWDRPAASEPLPEEKQGMSALRPPGKKGQLMGLDERSREIERNLGVR